MEKILTVIIPSYNTSRFIDETMRSFCDERFLEDIEILIIDDGSTDDTAQKAQKYVDMYPNSIVLISKENGGHGSGINVGVENARGKYFKVVDGDDYIDPDEMYRFTAQLKKLDSDMFISPYKTVSDVTGEIKDVDQFSYTLIEKKAELSKDMVYASKDVLPYCYASIHAATFRTELFKVHNLKMSEKVFYEDTEFVLFPIPYVDTIVLSSCSVYYYRVDQANQSVSKTSSQKRIGQLEQILKNVAWFYAALGETVPAERKDYILRALASQQFVVYSVYAGFESHRIKRGRELKKFDEEIKTISPTLHEYANRYKLVRTMRCCYFKFFPLIAWIMQFARK